MVDKLPEDIDRMTDVAMMRTMLEQLVEMGKSSQKSIEKLTQTIEQLQETIELKDAEIANLKRMLFGKKSERISPIDREVKKRRKKDDAKKKQDKEAADKKRKENADAKKKLPREKKTHPADPAECQCPVCGSSEYKRLADEVSYEVEYVPAHFKLIEHHREQWVCACGEHFVSGPAPARVSEGVQYGPGMHAHTVVSKCLDSIPFYRLSKQLGRSGVIVCRSTLCDMFHRMAELLTPVYDRIIALIGESQYVNADETRIKMQAKEKTKEAYIWVFIAEKLIGYVFSAGRSGETPVKVLGDSTGVLQVDQYSGYNQVTTPDKRHRAGCLAHMRRKFFEAKNKAPEVAKWVLEKTVDIYEVEYDAAAENILGTDKHLAMRQVRSAALMKELKEYLEAERSKHLPKGPMGKAISYAVDNWDAMSLFLSDPKIRLDNNISEGQLRLIALGRKNYLFVGDDVKGQNLAVLQTLVATCVANDVNPENYLADVVMRIQAHPQSRLDELLPNNWKPPPGD